jgi:hypothetical protein
MSPDEHNTPPRSATLRAASSFGLVAVVALAAILVAFAPRGRGGDATQGAAAPDDAPLIGYAPSAPATGAMLRYDVEYPTIPYTTGQRTDRVAVLMERIERGEVTLAHDGERGYLESLLAALEIDAASQTLVFSQTSLQSRLIGPRTPRAIYFNDDTYVGFVQQGPIEIGAVDPNLGPVFYLLDQAPAR